MARKESSVKTNAARILDAAGIPYELREYTVDEDHLSAPRVAEKIGMPPEQVFKTLVARGDRSGVLMASIPANAELDLKALAAASGNGVAATATRRIAIASGQGTNPPLIPKVSNDRKVTWLPGDTRE